MGADTRVTIGVFGHYGNENLGDEAIVEAVIQAIHAHVPGAKICAFSIKPADTEVRYRVPAYPIRKGGEARAPEQRTEVIGTTQAARVGNGDRTVIVKRIPPLMWGLRIVRYAVRQFWEMMEEIAFLGRSFRRLRGVDLLLVSGSNQFLDNFGGPWAFPYTLLKWSVLAKLRGAKLAFISVGAGPLDSRLSRVLVRVALLFSDYTSFRDQASRGLIETKLFRKLGPVYPDLAHGLVLKASCSPTGATTGNRPIVGINPMPVYDPRYWCEVDVGKYQRYVTQLARFASTLVRDGFPVFFFPTQPKDENVIDDVVGALEDDVRERLGPQAVRRGDSVYGLMELYAAADVVVATRFHGTLLALLAERPVLGICYYRKTRDLLREMGQDDYAVDFDGIDASDLLLRFRELIANRSASRGKIQQRNEEYRVRLSVQYQRVFSLLQSAPVPIERAT